MLDIRVDEGRLQQVSSFMYLGSRVTTDVDCAEDVKTRMDMGVAVTIKLTAMWKNKSNSTTTNLRVMKDLVRPTTTCVVCVDVRPPVL